MTSSSTRHAPGVVLGALMLLAGCSGEPASGRLDLHGPHGGHTALVSGGASFEVELTVDERRRRIVIYANAPGESRPYPLAVGSLSGRFEADGRTTEVVFAPLPLAGDPRGRASRFTLALDQLPQQLLASNRFVLKLSHAEAGELSTASISHRNDHGHEYRHD
ncbi:MAG: hypothetical protein AAGJ46_21590 [Planctomycetota bacterium]